MKHKEDLITPPWACNKPKKTSTEVGEVTMATLWLTKNGKTTSITKPERDIEHWRRKYEKDYTVSTTDPNSSPNEGCSGHECFKKKTGVCCSRCKD